MYTKQRGLKIVGNQDYGAASKSLGQKHRVCLGKRRMTTRAALGERGEVEGGKLK